jgi:hypothetical protein
VSQAIAFGVLPNFGDGLKPISESLPKPMAWRKYTDFRANTSLPNELISSVPVHRVILNPSKEPAVDTSLA